MARVLNIRDFGGMPDGAVYIGRANRHYGLARSKWCNPFNIGKDGTREDVIRLFVECSLPRLMPHIHLLRGKDLVCWCAPQACHGDVLLELANRVPDVKRAT
jgi:hypothetical protein